MLNKLSQVAGIAIADQHTGTGIFQGIVQLRLGMACVQGHNHQASCRHGNVGFEILVRVIRKNGHAITLLEVKRPQYANKALTPIVELAVGEFTIPRNNGQFFRGRFHGVT